jgi:hypothetical protein
MFSFISEFLSTYLGAMVALGTVVVIFFLTISLMIYFAYRKLGMLYVEIKQHARSKDSTQARPIVKKISDVFVDAIESDEEQFDSNDEVDTSITTVENSVVAAQDQTINFLDYPEQIDLHDTREQRKFRHLN